MKNFWIKHPNPIGLVIGIIIGIVINVFFYSDILFIKLINAQIVDPSFRIVKETHPIEPFSYNDKFKTKSNLTFLTVGGINENILNDREYTLADVPASQRKDIKALANTVYYEARGEERTGRIAIQYVVKNRAAQLNKSYYDIIHQSAVIKKNNGKSVRIFQFSYLGNKHTGGIKEPEVMKQIISDIIHVEKNPTGIFKNPIGKATMYNDTIPQSWKGHVVVVATLGAHKFCYPKREA
jgi:hypothetical protein